MMIENTRVKAVLSNPRIFLAAKQDVDGRHKAGHDGLRYLTAVQHRAMGR